MPVSQRDSRSELERGRPGVAEGDDSVEAELVQVGRFELTSGSFSQDEYTIKEIRRCAVEDMHTQDQKKR